MKLWNSANCSQWLIFTACVKVMLHFCDCETADAAAYASRQLMTSRSSGRFFPADRYALTAVNYAVFVAIIATMALCC
jgi:hypothetical protein